MRFLTRTFRNVFRVHVGNATFACGVRSAGEQSLEEARSETEVGRGLLVPKPRPLPPRTRPTSTQTEPQLEPATSAGVILAETGQFLLSCSLQLWQHLKRCRQIGATVQVFFTHFTSVLRKQFAANDTFLREENGYKQALALRNGRQVRQGRHNKQDLQAGCPTGLPNNVLDQRMGVQTHISTETKQTFGDIKK